MKKLIAALLDWSSDVTAWQATCLIVFSIALIALTILGCGKDPKDTTEPTAKPTAGTYQSVQKTVMPGCLGCHGINSSTGFDFSSYSALMASGVVLAGNPRGSKFFQQINSGAMPLGGQKLKQALIDNVSVWIKGGALNN